MINRSFSGGTLIGVTGLAAGRLEVHPKPRFADDGSLVLSGAAFQYTITDGELPEGATIPSPLYAEFLVYADGGHVPILRFHGEVAESETPVTLASIYRSLGRYPRIYPTLDDRMAELLAEHDADEDAHGGLAGGGLTLEQIQDAVAAMLPDSATVDWTYDDTAGTLTADATGLTTEQVQDIVGGLAVAGSNATVTYDDVAGTLTIASTGGGASDHGTLTGLSDDDHPQYHTDARGDARYSPLGHTHDDRYYTETETNTLLAAKAAAADLTTEATTRSAADTALDGRVDTLEAAAILLANPVTQSLVGRRTDGTYYYKPDADGTVYYIDSVLAENPTWTDDEAMQWIVDRATLDDEGVALTTPRSLVIYGTRKYSLSLAAFKETTTPNGGVTTGANAQLLVPGIGPITTKPFITITFRGPIRPTKSYSVITAGNTNVVGVDGFIIESTAAAPGVGVSPCMIGVSQAVNGYGSGSTYFSLVHLIFENVTLRTSNGAPITALDARHAIMLTTNGVSVDTGTTSNSVSDPSSSTAGYGVRSPQEANGAWIEHTELFIQGYKVGLEVTENTHIISAYLDYNYAGLDFLAASHGTYIERVLCQWNRDHVKFSGYHNVTIQQLDFEGYNTGLGTQWYKTRYVIDDPSNYGVGKINIVCGPWYLVDQISYLTGGILNGGAYLGITRHQPWRRKHNTGDAVAGNNFTSWATGNGEVVYYQNPAANGDISRHNWWCMPGVYMLTMWVRKGPNAGIIQIVLVDGNGNRTVATGIDLYAAAEDYNQVLAYYVPARMADRLYIRFEVTGKNASSGGYQVPISDVNLCPAWGMP